MNRSVRCSLFGAMAVASTVVLSACAPAFQPSTAPGTPRASPKASGSASPTAGVPPSVPAQARPATRSGAEAFTRWYISLIDHAIGTGQTTGMRLYSRPGCTACIEYAEVYRKRAMAEGGVSGDFRWHIKGLMADRRRCDQSGCTVDVTVAIGAYTSRASRTAEPATHRPRHVLLHIALIRGERTWLIEKLRATA